LQHYKSLQHEAYRHLDKTLYKGNFALSLYEWLPFYNFLANSQQLEDFLPGKTKYNEHHTNVI
jgi:hypothetical protein